MRIFLSLILAFVVASCSCGRSYSGKRIGVDPTWSPLNFEQMQPYVNGYTDEVLLEISRSSGLRFEKITANWDSLLDGMKRGQYDAVLTSLPPYTFNQAKYDFSLDFLPLGPVLLASRSSKVRKLVDLQEQTVGLIVGDPVALVLERNPGVILRTFPSIPEMLDAILVGEIAAAALDQLTAVGYVNGLYNGQIKIVSKPLTNAGLHLIAPKGKSEELVQAFSLTIKQFKKKKKLTELQKKWHLAPDY